MINIEETRECFVRTIQGKIVGRVKDLIYSPEDLRTRHPEKYLKLSAIVLERRGSTIEDLRADFPFIFVDDEFSFFYITKPEMENFEFISDTHSALEILRDRIMGENFKRYRYMSHTTPKWRACLKAGVEPRTYNKFLELKTQTPYSMWCGNQDREFYRLSHVDKNDDSGIIVTQRTFGHLSLLQYLLEKDMLSGRILYIFDSISNYFITFDVIEPKDFIVIYSMTGEKLWER